MLILPLASLVMAHWPRGRPAGTSGWLPSASLPMAVPRGEDGAELGGGHLLRAARADRIRPGHERAWRRLTPLPRLRAADGGDGEHDVRADGIERRRHTAARPPGAVGDDQAAVIVSPRRGGR